MSVCNEGVARGEGGHSPTVRQQFWHPLRLHHLAAAAVWRNKQGHAGELADTEEGVSNESPLAASSGRRHLTAFDQSEPGSGG